jgi:hypothetical protein
LVTKKRCSSSKQVRFSSPTKLPSLTVKKSPTLGVSAIKLASFSYPLQDRRHASTAHSPPSSSVIPASRVIDNLRHDLNLKFQNPTVKPTSSLHRPKRELVTPPPPPNCPDRPVPQIRRGVLSVPCTPTTPHTSFNQRQGAGHASAHYHMSRGSRPHLPARGGGSDAAMCPMAPNPRRTAQEGSDVVMCPIFPYAAQELATLNQIILQA